MQQTILFLNMAEEDPTKRLKLAGVRRYAAAAGWAVVPVKFDRSSSGNIPSLLAKYSPVGCICDDDATPMNVSPRLFGGIPIVFANRQDGRYDRIAGRVCDDTAAVAAAAFRELSSCNPSSFAIVGYPSPRKWSATRVEKFASLVEEAKRPCRVFPVRRNESLVKFATRLRPWVVALPPHTAIYAVNDAIARLVTDAALAEGLRIPRDLTLLGTDNDPAFCETASPTISSIQLDFERMGYLAAKLIGIMLGGLSREATLRPRSGHISGEAALNAAGNVTTVGPMLAMRRESTGGLGRREPHVLEAVEIIRREACDGLTVAKLASRLPGSRSLLDIRFREAMGHSVFDEILHVRLERVFDLLRQPETPISAIADLSGFGSLRALDKLFRSRFGCSLRAWRKRYAQP
jgi:LacI family transcriptional regulator